MEITIIPFVSHSPRSYLFDLWTVVRLSKTTSLVIAVGYDVCLFMLRCIAIVLNCSGADCRAKGKALTRARKLLEEGDEEIVKLSAHASELDSASCSMMARIDELEVRSASTHSHGECEIVKLDRTKAVQKPQMGLDGL